MSAKIAKATETRTVPAGSLYVPLDDPLAPVVIHLLEPEGPDSLFAWGELSSALEMKEYIDARVLDPLAEKLLKDDPKLAAEWDDEAEGPEVRRERARALPLLLLADALLGRVRRPPPGLPSRRAARARGGEARGPVRGQAASKPSRTFTAFTPSSRVA